MSYLPEFVAIYEIEPYIITALDDNTIREALISYFEHQDAFYSKEDIISIYGKIENWDTSRVTDMSKLFWIPRTDCYCAFWIFEPEIYHDLNLCYEFNEDISKWDVSNVENMTEMFMDCKKFNTPIGDWDVSKVKDMSGMFFMAENFNRPRDRKKERPLPLQDPFRVINLIFLVLAPLRREDVPLWVRLQPG